MLDIIKTLKTSKTTILTQVNKAGLNPLMLTLQHQSNMTEYMINLIGTLKSYKKLAVLTQTDKEGNNALFYAIKYQPTTIASLINVIKTLPHQEQAKILTQKNTPSHDLIRIITQSHPAYLTSFPAITNNQNSPQHAITPQENTFTSRFTIFKNRFATSNSKPTDVNPKTSSDTSDTISPMHKK